MIQKKIDIYFFITLLFFFREINSQKFISTESDDAENPSEIYAEEGIEWHKNIQKYIAKGNANARKADLLIKSDYMEAKYEDSENSENEITLLMAKGNVFIENSQAKIFGGHTAFYDLKKEYFKVTGNKLKLVSQNDELTSNNKIEFWKMDNVAIATGKAKAVKESKYTISADKLVWHLKLLNNEEYKVKKIFAYDNVKIENNNEVAYSDKALYNETKEICKLFGNVKLKKDNNFLTGEYAEMNLQNGISKLLPHPKSKQINKNRVKAIIKKENE